MIDYFLIDESPLEPQSAAAAVIVLDDGRYLLQLRDQKAGLFYPGHWGLFGGAIEYGETAQSALKRELEEELGLKTLSFSPLTSFSFEMFQFGIISRFFFEVRLPNADLTTLTLSEGSAVEAFNIEEALMKLRLVPYDSFAIWLHSNRARFK